MNPSEVERHLKLVLENLGLDLSDPNLQDTPKRITKMYAEEMLSSLECEFTNFTTFPNEDNFEEIILLDRIHFVSLCSHHFLPFVGLAWLGYIPNDLLVGASKPSRLISYFGKKPQLQEKLIIEVIRKFEEMVRPKGTFVLMRAIHGCMSCRGVNQYGGSGMTTSAVSGVFRTDHKARSEAFDLIKISLMFPNV